MQRIIRYVFMVVLFFAATGNCSAQKRVNRFDLKHRKQGYWKETITTDTTSIIHEGRYVHGLKQGLWKSTIDTDVYVINVIVTLYTKGKKNGWSSAYNISRYDADDTVRTIKSLYVNDSLAEEFALGYPEMSDIGWNKGTIWPIYRTYIKGDSVFQVYYFNVEFGDSGRVEMTKCWTQFEKTGSLRSDRNYPGPTGTRTILTKYYSRSGGLMIYEEQHFPANHYLVIEYHPNGKVKRIQNNYGAQWIAGYQNVSYYKNGIQIIAPRDTFPGKSYAVEFDSAGLLRRKTHYQWSHPAAYTQTIDSIYDPPGMLKTYSYDTFNLANQHVFTEFYASGQIRKKTVNDEDTIYYETGIIYQTRFSRSYSHVHCNKEYFPSGNTRNINWQRDSVYTDTIFYESGGVSEIRWYVIGRGYDFQSNPGDFIDTFYCENGKVRRIYSRMDGAERNDYYDDKGRLKKPK